MEKMNPTQKMNNKADVPPKQESKKVPHKGQLLSVIFFERRVIVSDLQTLPLLFNMFTPFLREKRPWTCFKVLLQYHVQRWLSSEQNVLDRPQNTSHLLSFFVMSLFFFQRFLCINGHSFTDYNPFKIEKNPK